MGEGFLDYADKWAGSNDSGPFPILKLRSGVRYQIRILDRKPTFKYVHFESLPNKTVICSPDGCFFCNRGDKRTVRHYVNIIDRADGKIKVFPFSNALLEPMREKIVEKQAGDPDRYDMVISKQGEKKETRYSVEILNPTPLELNGATLYNLEELLKPMGTEEIVAIIKGGSVKPKAQSAADLGLTSPAVSLGEDDTPI